MPPRKAMARKRKASQALESLEGAKVSCELPAGKQVEEEAFASTLAVCHTTGETVRVSKDISLLLVEGTSTLANTGDSSNEVVASDGDDSSSHSGKNHNPEKKVRILYEERVKMITLTCEWNMCTADFKKMVRFVSHIREHLLAITDPVSNDGYLCYWRDCDFACITREEMDRHVYFHAFHCKIKSIGAMILKERNLKCILDSSGRNLVPEILEAFQCMWEDCTTKFASANDFYCHALSHVINTDQLNSSKNAFKCAWNECSSFFSARSSLKNHIRTHTQEKIFGCPNCGGIFAHSNAFIDHCFRQIPHKAQQYQCFHCFRRYANERLLRHHVRCHIYRLKCSKCDVTLRHKSELLRHIRQVHKKEKPHQCSECGKRFSCASLAAYHLASHFNDTLQSCCPFKNCTNKRFSTQGLRVHILRVHSGLEKKPYVCHLCDSHYSQSRGLRHHLINFHGVKGQSKFRYRRDKDGYFRLLRVRYESTELKEMGSEEEEDEGAVDSPEASTSSPEFHCT